jgi:hypothetical protein
MGPRRTDGTVFRAKVCLDCYQWRLERVCDRVCVDEAWAVVAAAVGAVVAVAIDGSGGVWIWAR